MEIKKQARLIHELGETGLQEMNKYTDTGHAQYRQKAQRALGDFLEESDLTICFVVVRAN